MVDFARGLIDLGWGVLSSGGTAGELAAAGVAVTQVSELTGVDEALDGRLKTIHPIIFAGILARADEAGHQADLAALGAKPIGLVVCNLYPFGDDPSVELIDVGGPAMVRAAAKNHEYVGVVVDPDDYDWVLDELKSSGGKSDGGHLSSATRKQLAKKAFALTAKYDSQISSWLDDDRITPNLTRTKNLRYGENPHQAGELYLIDGSESFWGNTEQLNGKELSYLNIYDATAGWVLAHELGGIASSASSADSTAVIIKHANPCGAAIANTPADAFANAHSCDPVSAFGGIVALNQIDSATAELINDLFIEVVIAPDFDEPALKILRGKKNIRLLKAPPPSVPALHFRSVENAILVQTPDVGESQNKNWQVVTKKEPTPDEWQDLIFAEKIVAATSSNAVVIAKDQMALGIGAGQQNRKDSTNIAAEKAGDRAAGGVCASDGFLPFADGLDGAIKAGCKAVVQPGGSKNDKEVIAAAESAGLAMVFTGQRRFRH